MAVSSTLFAAASIASVAGAGLSAYSQYQSNKMQQATANQNAQIAKQTAELEADRSQRNFKRDRASAIAGMGSSGLLAGSGSSLSVLSDMASQQAENELNILYGGNVNSANARNRATAYGQQATGAIFGGVASTSKGLLSAGYEYKRNFPD